MKAKKTLIVYLNNGDLIKQVAKGMLFEKVEKELTKEGRVIEGVMNRNRSEVITYDDGSQIVLVPFGESPVGIKYNDIFIDKSCFNFQGSETMIKDIYTPFLFNVKREHYRELSDTEVFKYQLLNGKILTESYKG